MLTAKGRPNPSLSLGGGWTNSPESSLVSHFDPAITLETAGKRGLHALVVTGTYLGVSSGIGMLALFGVSVQTGVIMLEFRAPSLRSAPSSGRPSLAGAFAGGMDSDVGRVIMVTCQTMSLNGATHGRSGFPRRRSSRRCGARLHSWRSGCTRVSLAN